VLFAVCLSTASRNYFSGNKLAFIFLYPGTKGIPLGSKRGTTHVHNNPEYEASANCMHDRQLLTASCGIIARQCIIYYSVGFPSGKELALLDMCNQV